MRNQDSFIMVFLLLNPKSGASGKIKKILKLFQEENRGIRHKFKLETHVLGKACLDSFVLSSRVLNHSSLPVGPKDQKQNPCLFIACGGDGTVAALASALLRNNISAPMSVIPLGTGNDFARAIGFLSFLQKPKYFINLLGDLIEDHKMVPIDVWELNGQHFINYISFGFEAKTAYDFHHWREKASSTLNFRLMNKLSYLYYGLKNLTAKIPVSIKLKINGKSQNLESMRSLVLSNINSFGAGCHISNDIVFADQKLKGFYTSKIRQIISFNLNRKISPFKKDQFLNFSGSQFDFEVVDDLYYQIDGEAYKMHEGQMAIKRAGIINFIGDV